jgi:hypothetical protein
LKVTREDGTKRGQKFLELNRTHGREGLKEREARKLVNLELQYCVEILNLTGDYLNVKKRGWPKRPQEYKKIETLAQAGQYVVDEMKKDNAAKAIREDEERNGAKRRCISEIEHEKACDRIERDLKAIQSVIDWLPSTRDNANWSTLVRNAKRFKYRQFEFHGEERTPNPMPTNHYGVKEYNEKKRAEKALKAVK